LGGNESYILKLIYQKKIQAVNLKTKLKNKYLIDFESVYKFKKMRDRMLTRSDIAYRLDINDNTIGAFIKSGLLSPLNEPWCPERKHLFEPEEVEKFEREFLQGERQYLVDEKQEEYISIPEAVKKIKISIVRLLLLTRQGVFNPILCHDKKGLSRLLFNKNELKKYYRDECDEKKTRTDTLSLHWASALIGLDMRQLQYLIDVGLIKAMVKNINGKQTTFIQKKDFDEFKIEYAFIDEAAALMGFDTETVFQWIKQGRLKDYSQIPITKRSSIRVLRRDEIKPLTPVDSMGILQAAEYLDLSSRQVYTLISKNMLMTLKGKGGGKTPFNRIPREEIVRYKENVLKPTQENYMSLGQAAKYLGVGRSTIYRLRNKKILSTTNHIFKQATLIPLQELEYYKRRNYGNRVNTRAFRKASPNITFCLFGGDIKLDKGIEFVLNLFRCCSNTNIL
jgi:DNA-binding XRE family transcriptional regulator